MSDNSYQAKNKVFEKEYDEKYEPSLRLKHITVVAVSYMAASLNFFYSYLVKHAITYFLLLS
jgi:hypothetical protein